MTKQRAFLIHLCASATVVGLVCAVIFFVWYPSPYFAAKGAWNPMRVLLTVDLMVGPFMTLLLYRPGKWGLKFDMTVIVTIQLAALSYGTSIIYSNRPYFSVFAVDRFEVIAYHEIDQSSTVDARLLDKPLIGPKLVVGLLPEDPTERQQLMDEVLFQGRPDLDRRPEFWHPYDEQRAYVVNRAKDLKDLLARDEETATAVRRVLKRLQREPYELRYVPLSGRQRSFTYLIDAVTGEPVELIDVDPWRTAGQERSSDVPVQERDTEEG